MACDKHGFWCGCGDQASRPRSPCVDWRLWERRSSCGSVSPLGMGCRSVQCRDIPGTQSTVEKRRMVLRQCHRFKVQTTHTLLLRLMRGSGMVIQAPWEGGARSWEYDLQCIGGERPPQSTEGERKVSHVCLVSPPPKLLRGHSVPRSSPVSACLCDYNKTFESKALKIRLSHQSTMIEVSQ